MPPDRKEEPRMYEMRDGKRYREITRLEEVEEEDKERSMRNGAQTNSHQITR